jgi:hypothetical protein
LAKQAQSLTDRLDQKVFDAIDSRSLVYNTCWEDPAVDRLALALRPQDRMLVIASAGCNVLDFTLVARGFRPCLGLRPGLRAGVETLLQARSLAHTAPVCCEERRAAVPYLPGLRVPYYLYIGRKAAD